MILTNKYNIPEPIYNAVKAFERNYQNSKVGNEDFTVTELITPPHLLKLKIKHHDEYQEDVTDRVWSLFGQACHKILEIQITDNSLKEERLITNIDGVKLSGQIDFFHNGILIDYKIVSVWKYILSDYRDIIQQLNILAYLLETYGFRVDKIGACFIFRDYSKNKAKIDKEYPQLPIITIKFDKWSKEKTFNFIKERISCHRNNTEICYPDERKRTNDKYAVMKNDNKNASRLFDTRNAAYKYIEDHKDKKNKYRVEERLGEDKRCLHFCPVNKFCSYYLENYENKETS